MTIQEIILKLQTLYPNKVPHEDGRIHFSLEDDLYGFKIYKSDAALMYNYPCYAEWCNNFSNGKATIEQKEDPAKIGEDAIYYEIGRIPDPTPEELIESCRKNRDYLLQQFVDPVVTNPLRWEDMSEDEKANITSYRRYLLNYPESSENWYEELPKTYKEWLAD